LIELFLLEPVPVTKERIHQYLWGTDYNPLVDDKRIYQLIYRARQFFGKPDLFKNRYGSYDLNVN
jgi:DNA-binding winged helix-turn-helix (wHTH) protein